jgi:hypothetical protein
MGFYGLRRNLALEATLNVVDVILFQFIVGQYPQLCIKFSYSLHVKENA